MSKPSPLHVSVTNLIEAPADVVYDLVSDITRMGHYSPENTGGAWLDGATGPAVGARFKGTNKLGFLKWATKPTVTIADRGRRFAFQVPGPGGPLWTYEFESVATGTRVTESMHQDRPSLALIRFMQRRAGVTDRAEHLRRAMTQTLLQIAVVAERIPVSH